jgi:hypothetical protein
MDSNSPKESNGAGSSSPSTTDHAKSEKVDITDLLLVVFVHGFKGTDETFGAFPQRLQHILTETIPKISVECIVFPAYEVGHTAHETEGRA